LIAFSGEDEQNNKAIPDIGKIIGNKYCIELDISLLLAAIIDCFKATERQNNRQLEATTCALKSTK
jgi:hypothetical protein